MTQIADRRPSLEVEQTQTRLRAGEVGPAANDTLIARPADLGEEADDLDVAKGFGTAVLVGAALWGAVVGAAWLVLR